MVCVICRQIAVTKGTELNRWIFLLAALLVAVPAAPAVSGTEAPAPIVKGIRVFTSQDNFGVEITADSDLVYTCTKMPPLLKVIVDLPLTEPGRPDTDYRVGSALITTIRLEKKAINDVPLSRITINLTEDADYTARLDPADKKKLTIMLHKPAARATAAATATMAKPEQLQQPVAAPAPAPQPALPPVERLNTGPVTISTVTFNAEAIDIQSSGALGDFRDFTLHRPGRLVIDIPAARSPLRSIAVPTNRFGIMTARIGIFEGRLRLVFDAGQKPFPGYHIDRTDTGLRVLLTKGD
jgi:hypothetical protein